MVPSHTFLYRVGAVATAVCYFLGGINFTFALMTHTVMSWFAGGLVTLIAIGSQWSNSRGWYAEGMAYLSNQYVSRTRAELHRKTY